MFLIYLELATETFYDPIYGIRQQKQQQVHDKNKIQILQENGVAALIIISYITINCVEMHVSSIFFWLDFSVMWLLTTESNEQQFWAIMLKIREIL